jgi:hypothetical protein
LEYGTLQPSDIKSFSELTSEETISTIETLLIQKFILQGTVSDHITQSDRYLEEEEKEVSKAGSLLTATDMKKLRARMSAERSAIIADGPTGSKRKLLMTPDEIEKLEMLQQPDQFFTSDICYRVNFEQFHIHFRNEDVALYVETRIDTVAGQLARVFLAKVADRMAIVRETNTVPMSLQVFGMAVANAHVNIPAVTGSVNPLRDYMDLLSDDSEPFFTRDMISGSQYVMQLEYITQQFKVQIVLEIIKERLGPLACRIWRLLYSKKKLDDKQVFINNKVSKLALVDEKLGRECLYKMFKMGLLFIQVLLINIGCSKNSGSFSVKNHVSVVR